MGGTEMGALIVSVEKATVVVTEIDTKTEIGAMWKIEMTDVELDTGTTMDTTGNGDEKEGKKGIEAETDERI
eukprot:g23992.t1